MSYYILSLDGGGSWALIQARCLEKMYGGNMKGHELLRKFDLVVANSGGSLIAAALANDMSISAIIDLMLNEEKRRMVFSSLKFSEKSVLTRLLRLMGIGPKYSAVRKYNGLREILDKIRDQPMEELPAWIGGSGPAKPHFLITTFDYDRDRAVFIRSDRFSMAHTYMIAQKGMPNPNTSSFNSATLVQAVHGASNAPINYFDEPARFAFKNNKYDSLFWDGAVGGYNNPVLAAVTEALCNEKKDLKILSIGTGNVFLPLNLPGMSPADCPTQYPELVQERQESGIKNDLPKMTTSILSDPPDAASFIAYTVLYPNLPKEKAEFVRLNPLIQPVWKNQMWSLPDGLDRKEFKDLVELDMDAVKQEDVNLIDKFCKLWLEDKVPNQPIRNNGKLECVLGYPLFSKGAAAWKTHMP